MLRIPVKYICLLLVLLTSCKDHSNPPPPTQQSQGTAEDMHKEVHPLETTRYATRFELHKEEGYQILRVKEPWVGSNRTYDYLLLQQDQEIPEEIGYHRLIRVPVDRLVVTSTTHVAALEILGEENTLIGFPELDHISSEATRRRIAAGAIAEIGKNEALNTEILLDLNPDLVVGFSIDGSNRTFNNLEKSGIPVIFNADWMEETPLGKAEWIKFFGAILGKSQEADSFFTQVERDYHQARALAREATDIPSVVSGSIFRDQWFLPAGESWHAAFIADANAQYLYADTDGTGSLTLSLEAVLAKAHDADFWIGPAQFQSYRQMAESSSHYTRFKAYQQRQVYTYSAARGATGGLLFFELAPLRPDLVLKDLIAIFHPELLPEYEPHFYHPLSE